MNRLRGHKTKTLWSKELILVTRETVLLISRQGHTSFLPCILLLKGLHDIEHFGIFDQLIEGEYIAIRMGGILSGDEESVETGVQRILDVLLEQQPFWHAQLEGERGGGGCKIGTNEYVDQ